MSDHRTRPFAALLCLALLAAGGCTPRPSSPPLRSRAEAIAPSAHKVTPAEDPFPPILHSGGWEAPRPLEGPVNTAGAEDSPFITPDGQALCFFFTRDPNIPPQKQVLDGVAGIWCSRKVDGAWAEPSRVVLGAGPSMDGAEFIQGDTMWFASVRAGNYGEIDYYTARLVDGRWTAVKNAGRQLNKDYDVGELHISPDGQMMYCGGPEKWSDFKGKDILVLHKTDGGWSAPAPLPEPINTSKYNEDQPFLTADGNELWFTGESRQGLPGPAVFRSLKGADGAWGEPEEVISSFAGEPTLDAQGNIYFVHHYFDREMHMLEADIYVAYRR